MYRLVVVSLFASGLSLVAPPQLAWAESVEIEDVAPPVVDAPAPPSPTSATLRLLDEDGKGAIADPERDRAVERGIERFSIIGVSLASVPGSPVLFRVRSEGSWGPWREVEFNADHAEGDGSRQPGSTVVHSEPVWVDDADAYEIDLPAGSRPEVHLGHDVRTRVVRARPPAAGAAPTIHPRSAWSAREPTARPDAVEDLRLGIVHHSVTANAYGPGDVPGILRGIQAYHMDVQGWNDIAYNFAVDGFGRTWEARAGGIHENVIGGHAAGFNTGSVGVVLLGDYTSTPPSDAAVQATGHLLGWKFALAGVEPSGQVPYTTPGGTGFPPGTTVWLPRIVGHRDVGQTGCPGELLYRRLDAIRSIALARYHSEADAALPRPLAGNFTAGAGDDVLIERLGSGPDPLWTWTGGSFSKRDLLSYGPYRPAAGDFNGDGHDDIFWHGPGTLGDFLWLGGPGGLRGGPDVSIPGSYLPFAGDFDGDGIDDVFLYADGLATDVFLYGGTSGTFGAANRPMDGTYAPLVGDFDGDGRDDVLLHDPGRAEHPVLFGEGNRNVTTSRIGANGIFEPFLGDFDADGRSDVFWYTPGGDADFVYHGTPTRGFTASRYQVIGHFFPLVGDYTGDDADDVLWYSPGALHQPYWRFTAAGPTGSSVDVNGHFLPEVLDVEADGVDDILWYSPAGSALWRGTPLGFLGYGA